MKTIYTLRSQCKPCKLDKMDIFYRIPNATPKQLADKLKSHIRKKFWTEYNCQHVVKFTLIKEKQYEWDETTNQAVKVQ